MKCVVSVVKCVVRGVMSEMRGGEYVEVCGVIVVRGVRGVVRWGV